MTRTDFDILVEVKYSAVDIDWGKIRSVEMVGWDIEVVTRNVLKEFAKKWNVYIDLRTGILLQETFQREDLTFVS